LPSKPFKENEKRHKEKIDERLPLLIKKDSGKQKLDSGEVIDKSKLTMRYFIHNNPADGASL
jgi:hypothetical protein